MRSSRAAIRRNYMPWDPLQLCEKIDSGRRVRKNHVNFRPFRSFKRQILWSALEDRNLMCVTAKEEFEDRFLAELLKQFQPLRESISVSCYDFTGLKEEKLLALDDEYSFLTYHPYPESFSHFLAELMKHRVKIRKATEETKFSEAANKELQFIFIFLGEELLKDINNNVLLRNTFSSLARESARERIYLCPFVELSGFSFALAEDFSQVYFLGREAGEWVKELHPDWRITRNSFHQEFVGFGVFPPQEELVSLHWATFTLSEWGEEFRKKRKSDEALYRDFLESKADR